LESILVRKALISRIVRFLVHGGVIVINDFGFLYTPPTKARVTAQELDYRNVRRLTQAALLRWILAQTRITRCFSVLLEVSFYVFELKPLVTRSWGQSRLSKGPGRQQGQPPPPGQRGLRCSQTLPEQAPVGSAGRGCAPLSGGEGGSPGKRLGAGVLRPWGRALRIRAALCCTRAG